MLGGGAVGGYVGGHLALHDQDVTLIDFWHEHIEAIRKNGLQVRVRHQSGKRQSARPRRAADAARRRRRGDRIIWPMSEFGTSRPVLTLEFVSGSAEVRKCA
jgi:ketopantoate reductase